MTAEIDNEITEALETAEQTIDQQLQIPEELPLLPLPRHRDLSLHDRAAVCLAREINSRG